MLIPVSQEKNKSQATGCQQQLKMPVFMFELSVLFLKFIRLNRFQCQFSLLEFSVQLILKFRQFMLFRTLSKTDVTVFCISCNAHTLLNLCSLQIMDTSSPGIWSGLLGSMKTVKACMWIQTNQGNEQSKIRLKYIAFVIYAWPKI